jgi:hypothetical protein
VRHGLAVVLGLVLRHVRDRDGAPKRFCVFRNDAIVKRSGLDRKVTPGVNVVKLFFLSSVTRSLNELVPQ